METLERLKEIFVNINPDTDVDINSITLETSIMEDLGLNSIGVLYLVLAIEEEFNVVMHNSSIESFKTLGDVVSYIEENV